MFTHSCVYDVYTMYIERLYVLQFESSLLATVCWLASNFMQMFISSCCCGDVARSDSEIIMVDDSPVDACLLSFERRRAIFEQPSACCGDDGDVAFEPSTDVLDNEIGDAHEINDDLPQTVFEASPARGEESSIAVFDANTLGRTAISHCPGARGVSSRSWVPGVPLDAGRGFPRDKGFSF